MRTDKKLVEIDRNIKSVVPSDNILRSVMEELSDLSYLPYGSIDIDKTADPIFSIHEAGASRMCSAKVIEGVIIMSQEVRVCSFNAVGSGDGVFCSSQDSVIGTNHLGKEEECSSCHYNEHRSDKNGKGIACKKVQILYILRKGYTLPTVLFLYSPYIDDYKDYRIQLASIGKLVSGVMTKLTLTKSKYSSGTELNLEAVRTLSFSDVRRIREYRELVIDSNLQAAVFEDNLCTFQ